MATRFSELPRELRTAYHGTNSLLLPSIRRNGLKPMPHPLIEEAKTAARELFKKVEAKTQEMRRQKKFGKYKFASMAHGLIFTKGALDIRHLSRTNDTIHISSMKETATAYAERSPEVVSTALHFFLEDFVLKLNDFYASEFSAEQESFKLLYSRAAAHFEKGTPVVLTIEIPSLTYLKHSALRKISSDEIIKMILTTQMPDTPKLKYTPLCFIDSRLTLAKPLEPNYILKVEQLPGNCKTS